MFKGSLLLQFATLYVRAAQGMVASLEEAARILGVSPTATAEEIKKAYKQKVSKVHTDLPGSASNSKNKLEFKMLNAAFELIMNPPKEAWLDTDTSTGFTPPEPDDVSYEDIANMRKEMGREEFNKAYPGWEGELQREMGLDEYNSTFEGYDPNDQGSGGYDEYSGGYSDDEAKYESAFDHLKDSIYDAISEDLNKIPEAEDKIIFLEKLKQNKSVFDDVLQDKVDYIKRVYKYNDSSIKRMKSDAFDDAIRYEIQTWRASK